MRPSVTFALAAALAAGGAQAQQTFAPFLSGTVDVVPAVGGGDPAVSTGLQPAPGASTTLRLGATADGGARGLFVYDVGPLTLPRVTSATIRLSGFVTEVDAAVSLNVNPVSSQTVAAAPGLSSLSTAEAVAFWTDLGDGTPFLSIPTPASSPIFFVFSSFDVTVPFAPPGLADLGAAVAAAAAGDGRFGLGLSLAGAGLDARQFFLDAAAITLIDDTRLIVWSRNGSGAWTDGDNWFDGEAPDRAFDTVTIAPDRSLTVTGPGTDIAIEALTLGGGRGLARLSLDGGEIAVTNGTLIETTGELTGSGALRGDVLNRGTVIADDVGVVGGVLTNEGAIVGGTARNARVDADVVNAAGGVIDVAPGEWLRVTGDLDNRAGGRILVLGGALAVDGAARNAAAQNVAGAPEVGPGRIQTRDAVMTFTGGLTNAGLIQTAGDFTDVIGDVFNLDSGLISAAAGASLTFFDDLRNDGEVRTAAGARTVVLGRVSGAGAFTGQGTLGLEGGVSAGASPGLLQFLIDTDLGADSVNLFEIGGPLRGDQYDALDVAGTLTLGGDFEARLIDGFAPSAGDEFDLILAELIQGDFRSIALPALAGLDWRVLRTDTRFALQVLGPATPVPAPAAALLLASALGALAVARRRRA